MKPVIFIGPSILKQDAENILDAVYLDPAAQGDIYSAYQMYKPNIIGIVDGYFENVPSIWHKEILFVMSQGVHVLGSSSMGALRASELHIFGMVGVGKIFELYKDGNIEDDDEVAVFHGPKELGYPILSEAMVNIRQTALDALDAGLVSPDFYESFIKTGKSLYYKKRSYYKILLELQNNPELADEVNRFKFWLETGGRNLKREDAILLLKKIKKMNDDSLPAKQTTYHFEETLNWFHSILESTNDGLIK